MVVLTGGIASGKTTVARLFSGLGVPVIDTDLIAREIVAPGEPTLDLVIEYFGRECLSSDGTLDRERLRKLIFTDANARARLQAIMHPQIAKVVNERLRQLKAPYCILVVPLYVESSSYDWVDRVLVVDIPEELQIERVMARDRITRKLAEAILNAQASRDERNSVADDIIDNSQDCARLRRQVIEYHRSYMAQSRS